MSPPDDRAVILRRRARSNYESLVARMKRVHEALDEIERIAPKCSISACAEKWEPVAKKLFELEVAFHFSYTCPSYACMDW
ncbi:MAG: hypothetical protein L6Q84_26195 [Polyangiaceae bacterium]|nr:hypothetical protein [Polyangiaceae bacterium]